MNVEHIHHYSHHLDREMNIRVYGHDGLPLVAFPCQNGDCYNYEGYGFLDNIADFIEGGAIQLYVVDTVDVESWSDVYGDKGWRAWRQEQYYHYIVEEVLPCIYSRNHSGKMPVAFGCSLGATHAAIVFLRRSDLFGGCLALSGAYDAKYFFDGWVNDVLYRNSPVHFMENLPTDHWYVGLYNQRKPIFCVGQGPWEDEGRRTTAILRDIFQAKGIGAWCDFWGYDVDHDWPWWKKQMRYFLPYLLED